MADVTTYHNPRCSTSRAALDAAAAAGVQVDVVNYLSEPLNNAQLRALIAKLEDAPTDLIRRDASFAKLGLTDEAVATPDQVVAVLTDHPELMQRPVLERDTVAIIGRPAARAAAFLGQA